MHAPDPANDSNQQIDDNILRKFKIQNVEHLVIGSLNINSIRNKFDQLKLLVKDNIDILVIQETKIDDTFPVAEFCIDGYKTPFRKDRTEYGVVFLYI